MGVTGILGGAFDPPHNGHVALAEGARRELEVDRLTVLVVADPGHRSVHSPANARLRLAQAAFPSDEVRLDRNRYTVESVSHGQFDGAVFIVGADEGSDFPNWKDPAGVLRHVRLAVGTRHGYEQPELVARYGDRVLFFEIESPPISSSEIRACVRRGAPIEDVVPPAVAQLIAELGLYRDD